MNIFIIGSGGRESSLYYHLQNSTYVNKIYAIPGNAASETNIDLQSISIIDFSEILKKVQQYDIQCVIVGPELPLSKGIKDFFKKYSPKTIIIGPNQFQAQLESSKIFSFQTMKDMEIPQAEGNYANSYESSLEIIKSLAEQHDKYVIKFDGLAAGKGVSIHDNIESGKNHLKQIFHDKIFQKENNRVLIQKFMVGKEVSLFALCNGKEAIYLPTSQDYKSIYENNLGPNTGGMGSYAPTNTITDAQMDFIHTNIVGKILQRFEYQGLLYLGLMLHSQEYNGVSIVEFNCRFGDPEIQSILPIIAEDIFPYLLWTENKSGDILIPKYKVGNHHKIPAKNQTCVNVVLSALGYPKQYPKNLPIRLPDVIPDNYYIYPAGLIKNKNGYYSNGGRIMSIANIASSIDLASENIYSFIDDNIFPLQSKDVQKNLYYRRDIGK